MKSIPTLAALAVAVLGSTVAAPAADNGMKGGAMMNHAMVANHIVVKLNPVGGSGESGTATFTRDPEGQGTMVTLALHGGSAAPQPSHIHLGTCGSNGPIKWPLKPVVAGRSATMVLATIPVIMSSGAYINVHKSPKELANIVSCGNVPKVSKGAM
jgi:hypothetical protein